MVIRLRISVELPMPTTTGWLSNEAKPSPPRARTCTERIDQAIVVYDLLSGLRIVELGHILNGPLAGQVLGDFGAEVIKVEPLSGDVYRYAAQPQ